MPRMIFVSLPVADVARSRGFYTALGFAINDRFSGETTACVVVSDTICLMISPRERLQEFTPKKVLPPAEGTTALISLSCDSRAEVDAMAAAALQAGGSELHPPEDLGFMYSRAFDDPDGNSFGILWMDPQAAAEGPPPEA